MVVMFVGCGCVAETRKNVLFLRRITYGGIVFVPAGTQIRVKLLINFFPSGNLQN
jgi:hypothetical protein